MLSRKEYAVYLNYKMIAKQSKIEEQFPTTYLGIGTHTRTRELTHTYSPTHSNTHTPTQPHTHTHPLTQTPTHPHTQNLMSLRKTDSPCAQGTSRAGVSLPAKRAAAAAGCIRACVTTFAVSPANPPKNDIPLAPAYLILTVLVCNYFFVLKKATESQ